MDRTDFSSVGALAQYLEEMEERYTALLFNALYRNAGNIEAWYNEPNKVIGSWRGKMVPSPTDKSERWDQVGENVLVGTLNREFRDWSPIGLPIGSEVRFGTRDAVVHVDVKTHKEGDGDLDKTQDVRPEQVSADEHDSFVAGINGVTLGDCPPRLPPYYEFGPDLLKITITAFIICVYVYDDTQKFQYLSRLQLFTVPNGVIRQVIDFSDCFRAGKDGAAAHRYRIILPALKNHQAWRWREIRYEPHGFLVTH